MGPQPGLGENSAKELQRTEFNKLAERFKMMLDQMDSASNQILEKTIMIGDFRDKEAVNSESPKQNTDSFIGMMHDNLDHLDRYNQILHSALRNLQNIV